MSARWRWKISRRQEEVAGPETLAVAGRMPARAPEPANREVSPAAVTGWEHCDFPADFAEMAAELEEALFWKPLYPR